MVSVSIFLTEEINWKVELKVKCGTMVSECKQVGSKSQVLGSSWGQRVVPEAVIDMMRAHPTPKNGKEVQVFVGILGSWRLLFPMSHSPFILYVTW